MAISTVRKFGVGVASLALVASAVAPAFAADNDVKLPGGLTVERLSGDDRVDTSLAAAKKLLTDNTAITKAYIVGYNAVVDAAVAGTLKDGVIIVAPNNKAGQLLLGKVLNDDDKLKNITSLVAIGGKGVVADEVIDNLKKYDENITSTDRISGANRYETAVAIAKAAFENKDGIATTYLVRGDNIVDALSAGALLDGPVLLVNQHGDVDKSVVEYFKDKKDRNGDVIALGGTGVLSDAQVLKVVGDPAKKVSPWEFASTESALREKVQRAAAAYFGQDAWQKQAKDSYIPEKDLYFGLGDTGAAVAGTSVDPRDIDIKNPVTAAAKTFVGSKDRMPEVVKNVEKIQNKVKALKADLDKAIRDAKDTNAEAKDWHNNSTTFTEVAGVKAAIVALYGVDPKPNTVKQLPSGDYSIQADGSYKFDKAGKFVGVNEGQLKAAVNKVAKDDIKDSYIAKIILEKGKGAAAEGHANAAGQTPDDTGVAAGKNLLFTVLDELAGKTEKTEQAKHDAAKKALDAAVAAYDSKPWDKVVTRPAGGVSRIVGSDRYETSALLSYYATQKSVKPVTAKNVYLASGKNANLIDSVVAGQLIDGPILLVADKFTNEANLEMKRLLKVNANLNLFVIGGKGAVSDATVKEAGAYLN